MHNTLYSTPRQFPRPHVSILATSALLLPLLIEVPFHFLKLRPDDFTLDHYLDLSARQMVHLRLFVLCTPYALSSLLALAALWQTRRPHLTPHTQTRIAALLALPLNALLLFSKSAAIHRIYLHYL